jgi:hypothetical protein
MTDPPVIVKTKQLMAKAPASKQVLSLAQGIVHWAPPPAATALASKLLAAGEGVHGYGLAGDHPRSMIAETIISCSIVHNKCAANATLFWAAS